MNETETQSPTNPEPSRETPSNPPSAANLVRNAPVILTDEQREAETTILDWLDKPVAHSQEFKLGGYAGTGKTTLIKSIRFAVKGNYHTLVAAFTGKAVSVLGRKGVSAQTLHSLMYNCDKDSKGVITFTKKAHLEDHPDLIIVDEASMISRELLTDLLSFRTKVLFVGDPGQLEPVGDNPDLMRNPDFTLSKIHRQAADSRIISLASAVRTGAAIGRIDSFKFNATGTTGEVIIKDKRMEDGELAIADQVICAKNTTRKNLNSRFRVSKGLKAGIDIGDKLICLRNNLNLGVFNGLIFFVDEILKEETILFRGVPVEVWQVKGHDEIGTSITLPVWKLPFLMDLPKDTNIPGCAVYCDYGYVITCHKSQGSEWDNVLVIDEWMPPKVWDMKRWRYTAITRAAKKLTFCM